MKILFIKENNDIEVRSVTVKIYSINEKDIIDIREWGIKDGK